MSRLLRLLLAYLCLGVGDAGDPDSTAPQQDLGAPDEGDPAAGGDTLEDLADLDVVDPAPADPAPRRASDEEVVRAREEAARERARADDLARRLAPAPVDPETQREQDELARARAAGASPEHIRMLEWTHQSNRTLRESQRTSQAALAQARDLADQTAFEKLEITNPGLYKRYKPRVDAEVARLAGLGQSAPRTAILRFLVGDDMVSGKLKKTVKTEPKPPVNRGQMPAARTDVSGRRGVASEREKRRERLRDVPL